MDHWRRGHKQICKEIHRGGNAEQYNADKKYKEAVAVAVENLSVDLIKAGKFREAQSILSKVIPIARQKLGAENDVTLQLRSVRAQTLFQPDDATRNEVNEAITTLEELVPVVRRVFGKTHPKVRLFQGTLDAAKAKLEFK